MICDGATKCPCVFDVAPLTRGACPGFDAIVLAHERRHLGDVDCNPSGGICIGRRSAILRTRWRPSARIAGISIAEMDRIIPGSSGICRTGMTSIRAGLHGSQPIAAARRMR